VSLEALQDVMVQRREFALFRFEQILNIVHSKSIQIAETDIAVRPPIRVSSDYLFGYGASDQR
jgi:hypothetical protein